MTQSRRESCLDFNADRLTSTRSRLRYYKIYQLLAKIGLIAQYSAMDIPDFLQEIRKIRIDGQWYLKEATAKTGKVLKKLGLDL